MTSRRRWVAGMLLGGLASSVFVSTSVPMASATALGDAQQRATALRHQVDALNDKAEIATERYDESYAVLGAAVNEHITAQQQLAQAQLASGDTDQQRAQRARALYTSGGGLGLYSTLLDSGDINDAASRLHQVQVVLNEDTDAVDTANSTVANLQAAENTLARTAAAATSLQKKVARQASAVRALLAQSSALLASADAQVRDIVAAQARAAAAAEAASARAVLAAAHVDLGSLPDVPASPTAAAVLAFANAQRGKEYVWGATGPDSYDCSGLTGAAYAAAGIALPRTSREQWFAGPHIALADLQPGDLLFWAFDVNDPSTIHHVAIYAGNGMMIAAPHTGTVVQLQPVYLDGYIGAVRPDAGDASTAVTNSLSVTAGTLLGD